MAAHNHWVAAQRKSTAHHIFGPMGLKEDPAQRYPLALADMRTCAPAGAWWFECGEGWRPIVLELLDRLEAEIAAQPEVEQHAFRVVQVKEKFGTLRVYLAGAGTERMEAGLQQDLRGLRCTRRTSIAQWGGC